jgi:hypothetical protein
MSCHSFLRDHRLSGTRAGPSGTLHVAEKRETGLVPAGQVRFGFAGKGLWAMLDALRTGPPGKGGAVSIEPGLNAAVKFFGRYNGGAIRDGVLLSIERLPVPRLAAAR